MSRIKKSGLVVCQEVTDCSHCLTCEHSKPHKYDDEEISRCENNCGYLDKIVDCVPVETIKNLPKFS